MKIIYTPERKKYDAKVEESKKYSIRSYPNLLYKYNVTFLKVPEFLAKYVGDIKEVIKGFFISSTSHSVWFDKDLSKYKAVSFESPGFEAVCFPEKFSPYFEPVPPPLPKYQYYKYLRMPPLSHLNTGIRENEADYFSLIHIPMEKPYTFCSYIGGKLDNFTLGDYYDFCYLRVRTREYSRSLPCYFNQSHEHSFDCQTQSSLYKPTLGTTNSYIILNSNAGITRQANQKVEQLQLRVNSVMYTFLPAVRTEDNVSGMVDEEKDIFCPVLGTGGYCTNDN